MKLVLPTIVTLSLTACVTDGWENLPRKYVETEFQTKEDCQRGLEYMIATDERRDEREAANPICKEISNGNVIGRYKQSVEFRDDPVSSFIPVKAKDIIVTVDAPDRKSVAAYLAKKTEPVDAQPQTERKIP